ncbi:MAG: ABC transporter ATP-binding protein [Pseudoclavibacter sp.]
MLRTLLRLLPSANRRRLLLLVARLVAAAALQGIALGLAGVAIAECLRHGTDATAWMLALAAAIVAFVVVQWAAQLAAFRSDASWALHLRLGEHLATLPLGWLTSARRAKVIDLATAGVPQSMSYPAILLRPAVTAIVTPIAAGCTLALIDWRYTTAVVASSVVAFLVSRASDRLAQRVDARRHRVGELATRRVLEYATLQPVIRTDGRPDRDPGSDPDVESASDADDRGDALGRAIDDVRDASLRSAGTVIPGLVAFSLTLNVAFGLMIALGIAWVTGATITVPGFLGATIVIARLSSIASAGAELAAGLRLQRGVLERLGEVLDQPPLPALPRGAAAEPARPPASSGDLIRVEHISFRYDDAAVLDDVSFSLPETGLTALVGASGAGKTTLARLLARFWDPSSGRVLLRGDDVRSLPMHEHARHLATVLQDDTLLDATIGENIRLGKPDATDAEVEAVLVTTGLAPFVADLPDGLATPVGPGGGRLSGGQRQRVCVARAVLKGAPLTIMDEATSALDPENTRLVGIAARELARRGSVLVIAHDLDTIAQADQVLVLDGGRLVQHGTPGELRAQPGPFSDLLAHG